MCTGKTWKVGLVTTGGRCSKVSVSSPTTRAPFLIRNGARVVGDDTLTFEQRPPVVTSPTFQVFPVHMRVIADSGVYIVENLNLEELSAAKAYEFVAVVPPLRILGGTGSALRAFALVPRDD